MNGKGILKKPKTEIESDGEPDIKIEKPNKNISTSDDDDNNDASTSNYEEQEEALVALLEHRSKEVQHLTNRITYYHSELKQAQEKLNDTEAKLVKLRRKISDKKWNDHLPGSKKEVKTERKSTSSVDGGESAQQQPQSKPPLLISKVSKKPSRPMTLSESGSKASPSRYNSPMKARGDRSNETPARSALEETKSQTVGAKRKLESKEHIELIPKVRSSSSPSLIHCHASSHISSQHKRKLRSLTVCPATDNLFITSALDGMVHLWQIQAKGSGATLLHSTECLSPKRRRWPEDIAWHPEGKRIFAVYTADGGDNQIAVLNLNNSQSTRVSFIAEKPHVKGIINNISFMPWNDTCFATGGSDHAVVLWNENNEGDVWKPKKLHSDQHTSAVMGVAGMRHKQMIVSAGADKRIIGYDVLAGRAEYKNLIESKCMSVLPNPCDFHLFMVQTGTAEKQLRLCDIRLRHSELHAFGWKQESSDSQSALINQTWSPDGLYLTSGSADPMIHVFDIRYNAHKPSQSIRAHHKRVFKAEWHPSLPLLISISSDLNIGLHKI